MAVNSLLRLIYRLKIALLGHKLLKCHLIPLADIRYVEQFKAKARDRMRIAMTKEAIYNQRREALINRLKSLK